jgi:hypothetical protein
MEPLELYKRAWSVVSRDLVSWFVLAFAWFCSLLLCGLGVIFTVNLTREARAAVEEGRGPSLGGLFSTANLGTDILALLIFILPFWVLGASTGGLVSLLVGLAFQLLFPIVADGRYAPIDAAKLSVKHAMAHWQHHLIFLAIGYAVGVVGGIFFVTIPAAVALREVAQWLLLADRKGEIDALAQEAGIRQLGGA